MIKKRILSVILLFVFLLCSCNIQKEEENTLQENVVASQIIVDKISTVSFSNKLTSEQLLIFSMLKEAAITFDYAQAYDIYLSPEFNAIYTELFNLRGDDTAYQFVYKDVSHDIIRIYIYDDSEDEADGIPNGIKFTVWDKDGNVCQITNWVTARTNNISGISMIYSEYADGIPNGQYTELRQYDANYNQNFPVELIDDVIKSGGVLSQVIETGTTTNGIKHGTSVVQTLYSNIIRNRIYDNGRLTTSANSAQHKIDIANYPIEISNQSGHINNITYELIPSHSGILETFGVKFDVTEQLANGYSFNLQIIGHSNTSYLHPITSHSENHYSEAFSIVLLETIGNFSANIVITDSNGYSKETELIEIERVYDFSIFESDSIINRDIQLRKSHSTLSVSMSSSMNNDEYRAATLRQIVLGDFTDDVTFHGTATQIAFGLFGVDLPADIRDLVANFLKEDKDWAQITLTGIGVLPIVGVIKHADEFVPLVKHGDEILEVRKAITKSDELADYIKKHGKLPSNFITKEQAKTLGWASTKGNLSDIAPGKSIGGDVFYNDKGLLPIEAKRIWYEADVEYSSGYRGTKRLLYSNDGLFYLTDDHYTSFTQLK